jgi:hypothetical protein
MTPQTAPCEGSIFSSTLVQRTPGRAAAQPRQHRNITIPVGLVTAQTFLQLQHNSPHLQLEQCEVAALVEGLQLAAVAENCPQSSSPAAFHVC